MRGNMLKTIFQIDNDSPLIFTAIHSGHALTKLAQGNMNLLDNLRLVEEDPYTDLFAKLHDNFVITPYSRFEIDLNRRRTTALYRTADDCWGLDSRKDIPSEAQENLAFQIYDEFYADMKLHLDKLLKKYPKFIILDLHSYNHNRAGDGRPFDDPQKNPEIIIGTSNMSEKWHPMIKDFHKHLLDFDFEGRPLDVRINVKYPGGNFPRWIHNTYPEQGISIAMEVKKIFMNEWTGKIYPERFKLLQDFTLHMKKFLLDYLA